MPQQGMEALTNATSAHAKPASPIIPPYFFGNSADMETALAILLPYWLSCSSSFLPLQRGSGFSPTLDMT